MNCPVDPWELTQSGNELSRFTSELTEYKMSVGVMPRTLNMQVIFNPLAQLCDAYMGEL